MSRKTLDAQIGIFRAVIYVSRQQVTVSWPKTLTQAMQHPMLYWPPPSPRVFARKKRSIPFLSITSISLWHASGCNCIAQSKNSRSMALEAISKRLEARHLIWVLHWL